MSERTIIPAEPGWLLVRFVNGGERFDDRLEYEPIIAWSIACIVSQTFARSQIVPLTLNDKATEIPWGVKSPDGKYHIRGELFRDEGGVLETLRDYHNYALAKAGSTK